MPHDGGYGLPCEYHELKGPKYQRELTAVCPEACNRISNCGILPGRIGIDISGIG